VRLAGGTDTEGRLEVRNSSAYTWGYVCNYYFDAIDAGVACRSMRRGLVQTNTHLDT
jgi:Scavenger receptor cysteine-rich domain